MYVKEPKKDKYYTLYRVQFSIKDANRYDILAFKQKLRSTYVHKKEENRQKSISLLSKNRRDRVDPTGTIKMLT